MSLTLKANCYGYAAACCKFYFFCRMAQAYKGWETLGYSMQGGIGKKASWQLRWILKFVFAMLLNFPTYHFPQIISTTCYQQVHKIDRDNARWNYPCCIHTNKWRFSLWTTKKVIVILVLNLFIYQIVEIGPFLFTPQQIFHCFHSFVVLIVINESSGFITCKSSQRRDLQISWLNCERMTQRRISHQPPTDCREEFKFHFENRRTIYSYFDFGLKNSSFRLRYQRPSSSADCARELFKGSNGSASLVDCTWKKIFWLGGADFLWLTS